MNNEASKKDELLNENLSARQRSLSCELFVQEGWETLKQGMLLPLSLVVDLATWQDPIAEDTIL